MVTRDKLKLKLYYTFHTYHVHMRLTTILNYINSCFNEWSDLEYIRDQDDLVDFAGQAKQGDMDRVMVSWIQTYI